MITYHEFMFPIEQKYFPALKVTKQPCARVTYRVVDETDIEVTEIGIHPVVIIHAVNFFELVIQIEGAAKEHYNDIPEPEYNDLEQHEKAFL